jgi:hypothetical protein
MIRHLDLCRAVFLVAPFSSKSSLFSASLSSPPYLSTRLKNDKLSQSSAKINWLVPGVWELTWHNSTIQEHRNLDLLSAIITSGISGALKLTAHQLPNEITSPAYHSSPGRSICDLAQDGCASCARVRLASSILLQLPLIFCTDFDCSRLTEEVLHESTDARTEVLAALRELGPPDLVQLIKQAPRSQGKQVCQER